MSEAEDKAFRHLAASVMAQDMLLRLLTRMFFVQFPQEEQRNIAEGLRQAMRRTDALAATSPDDFHAEMQADVAVLAQGKLEDFSNTLWVRRTPPKYSHVGAHGRDGGQRLKRIGHLGVLLRLVWRDRSPPAC